jgi:hypothetical protein
VLADLFQGKLWAAADPERRRTKRAKDELDLMRIPDRYPEYLPLLPPALRARLYWQEGYMSCTGRCFEIGLTVSTGALQFGQKSRSGGMPILASRGRHWLAAQIAHRGRGRLFGHIFLKFICRPGLDFLTLKPKLEFLSLQGFPLLARLATVVALQVQNPKSNPYTAIAFRSGRLIKWFGNP